MLASGLPDLVADDEDLARFLTSSGQFNAQMAKPPAFLPSTSDRETSVFRHGSDPRAALWALGNEHAAGNRTLHGAAIVKAGEGPHCLRLSPTSRRRDMRRYEAGHGSMMIPSYKRPGRRNGLCRLPARPCCYDDSRR
jgi:hypothetical protein